MSEVFRRGICPCHCGSHDAPTRLIAVTGGPGAGKTAVLEMATRAMCSHVAFLPESAGIVFGGGFPRNSNDAVRAASQRVIFHVQRELEELVLENKTLGAALCDRGTLDGVAYWPGDAESYFAQLGTTHAAELARYYAVLHLRTPAADGGYNQDNTLRIESAEQARVVDTRIAEVWADHPRRHVVDSTLSFMDKASEALHLLRGLVPGCCGD